MTPNSRFQPLHVERTGEFTIQLPLRHVFPLFSPEGERAWVADWDPVYLHPSHPSDAPGTVFRTIQEGEETLWLILRYDPQRAIAEYGRFTLGSRLGTMRIQCREEAPDLTRVTVTYALTALTTAGNTLLVGLTPEHHTHMLDEWRDTLVRSQASRPQ